MIDMLAAGDGGANGPIAVAPGDLVSVTDTGRVRTLTLNRPEARNALSSALRAHLIKALQAAEADGSVGAIVLTGAGSAFAAGADLGELEARDSDEQREFLQPPHIYSVIEGLRKPVVAAVNGHALGAGLELATACDVRIGSPKAKFGQPEVLLGLVPGGGGTQRLVRLLGKGHASRLVLTGLAIDAAEALRIGLIDFVADDAVQAAIALAATMASNDPEALATAKRLLQAAVAQPYAAGLVDEVEAFVALHARPESKAKVQAFLAKRSP